MHPLVWQKSLDKKTRNMIIEKAGSNYDWFRQAARGRGKFSVELAIKLEAYSRIYCKNDCYMTADEILGISMAVLEIVSDHDLKRLNEP